MRDQVALCLCEVDPSTETETRGLVASDPGLRPADVLTKAPAVTGEVALDIMIKSPHALDAGANPTLTAVTGKLDHYRHALPELRAIGIEYKPFVYTTYGAPDPLSTQILEMAARKAPACPRAGTKGQTLGRWRHRIAVAIWRRAARMAHRCLPPLADPELDNEICRGRNVEGEVEEGLYQEEMWEDDWEQVVEE